MDFPTVERPPSLRSVASNPSLTRRSRTRTRSKTLTSSPRADVTTFRPPIPPLLSSPSSQIYHPDRLVAEPADFVHELDREDNVEALNQDDNVGAQPRLARESKAAAQARTLPTISTAQFKSPPSAFSRVPSIPQLYDLGKGNVRDSVLSQGSEFSQSGGSSSVYPPSTSTASGTDSPPSPRSIAEQEDSNVISSFDPELEVQEYDGDDVSYRLRLLVKNNYFLPPAHSKPSSSDFAASKKASRPPMTPTFFDMFRKSRSKPSTPTASPPNDFFTPMLRTTSDSTTVSAYPPNTPRRRSSSQGPQPGASQDPSGRVVVVREKMHDIATAAKQAEQEMKSRGTRREESAGGHSEVDIIDPTDAVDLPPPSAAYPFAVQASALHEMGVQDSVGAAALADRLPPRSPGEFSVENDWRKALLHAAVDHSLNNSSGVLSSTEGNPISPVSDKRMLGQRIVSSPIIDEPQSSAASTRSRKEEADGAPRPSSYLPVRVDTPSMPMAPLAPPPRRLVNPLYSISQTSLPVDLEAAVLSPSLGEVRQIEPTPRLSDSYESGVRHAVMSPPLISRESSEGSSSKRSRTSSDSSESYSEKNSTDQPRPSISSSIRDGRPSLSINSQPSPATSAFQDAIGILPVVNPPARGSSLRPSLNHSSSTSPTPRDSMATPPPRVSSSLAHITPLSPPPRSSSLGQRLPAPSRVPPPLPTSLPVSSESPEEILGPGPITPPFPIPDRKGSTLVLEIPQTNISPSIRSAPAPSSFFDSIQNQPNAMDDLDSSDESEDEDDHDQDHHHDLDPPTPIFVERNGAHSNVSPSPSSSRSLLMRLGNHSSPYVGRSPVSSESKKPISNIPVAGAFFTERRGGKSDQGHGPPTSTFDFYQYAQQHPLIPAAAPEPPLPRRPHTSDQSVKSWQNSQRAQDSLRQLDGMLRKHVEAEKDAIKRIATNLQSNTRP